MMQDETYRQKLQYTGGATMQYAFMCTTRWVLLLLHDVANVYLYVNGAWHANDFCSLPSFDAVQPCVCQLSHDLASSAHQQEHQAESNPPDHHSYGNVHGQQHRLCPLTYTLHADPPCSSKVSCLWDQHVPHVHGALKHTVAQDPRLESSVAHGWMLSR